MSFSKKCYEQIRTDALSSLAKAETMIKSLFTLDNTVAGHYTSITSSIENLRSVINVGYEKLDPQNAMNFLNSVWYVGEALRRTSPTFGALPAEYVVPGLSDVSYITLNTSQLLDSIQKTVIKDVENEMNFKFSHEPIYIVQNLSSSSSYVPHVHRCNLTPFFPFIPLHMYNETIHAGHAEKSNSNWHIFGLWHKSGFLGLIGQVCSGMEDLINYGSWDKVFKAYQERMKNILSERRVRTNNANVERLVKVCTGHYDEIPNLPLDFLAKMGLDVEVIKELDLVVKALDNDEHMIYIELVEHKHSKNIVQEKKDVFLEFMFLISRYIERSITKEKSLAMDFLMYLEQNDPDTLDKLLKTEDLPLSYINITVSKKHLASLGIELIEF